MRYAQRDNSVSMYASYIRRSVRLFKPKVGPISWRSSNVLDKCNTFYWNTFTDRHLYIELEPICWLDIIISVLFLPYKILLLTQTWSLNQRIPGESAEYPTGSSEYCRISKRSPKTEIGWQTNGPSGQTWTPVPWDRWHTSQFYFT
jgi:hypothetical protein